MKSLRLRIAAKLVMFIGLASCMLGAGIYCVLCMPEVLNLPFNLSYLLIVGSAAIVFVLVSVILHICANRAELSLEEYVKDENAEETLADLAVNIQDDVQILPSEEIIELPEDEPSEKEKKVEKKPLLPKDKIKLIKLAAIITVPTVLVGMIAVSSAKAKKRKKIEKERKEKEANRQAFYRWLG